MSKITGRETVVAFKKAAAWRTAVQVGADSGIFITSDGMLSGHAVEVLRDESLPLPWAQDSDTGRESISGDITAWLRYQDELMFSLAMGAPQTKVIVGAGPYYTMEVYLATTLRGLFGTYATLLESTKVAEVPSLKVTGFDLSAEYGNPVEIVYHTVGNRMLLTGDVGIINTPTDLGNVTVADEIKQNRVIFDSNSDFWINLEGGAALAVGDRLGISAFNFSFDRPQDGFYAVNGSDNGIEEPITNALPAPTFQITLPEFDATSSIAYKAALRSGATYKCKLHFAKGSYYWDLYIPRMRVIEDAPAVTGPGRIENQITFQLLQATALPTGFSSALPFYVQNKNLDTVEPF